MSRIRLSTGVERAASAIEHVWPGFDVIEGYIDSPDPILSIDKLRAHCAGLIITERAKPYAPMSGVHIKVLQPSSEFLQILLDDLGGRYTFDVTYLEVAADFFLHPSASRNAFLRWLLGHLTFKHLRQRVVRAKRTRSLYYGRRTNKAGQRRSRVGVIYNRRSKLAGPYKGRKCVHVELRLSGIDAVRSVGVFTLPDLIDFNHTTFWPAVAKLRRIAGKTKLGRIIGGRADNATPKALQKRARTWRDQHRIGRAFVLHNALLAVPRANGALEPIDFKLIFRFSDPAE